VTVQNNKAVGYEKMAFFGQDLFLLKMIKDIKVDFTAISASILMIFSVLSLTFYALYTVLLGL